MNVKDQKMVLEVKVGEAVRLINEKKDGQAAHKSAFDIILFSFGIGLIKLQEHNEYLDRLDSAINETKRENGSVAQAIEKAISDIDAAANMPAHLFRLEALEIYNRSMSYLKEEHRKASIHKSTFEKLEASLNEKMNKMA